MTKSRRLLYFITSFFVGIAIRDLFLISWVVIYCLVLVIIILYTFFCRKNYFRIAYIVLFGLVIGFSRMGVAHAIEQKEKFLGNFVDKTYTFNAEIIREPDIRDTHQKITVGNIVIENIEISGKILLLTGLDTEYKYKDSITVTCHLEKPEPFESFRYDKYLERFSIYAICPFPKTIQKTENDSFGKDLFFLKKNVLFKILKLYFPSHTPLLQ